MDYSPCGHQELDMSEQLSLSLELSTESKCAKFNIALSEFFHDGMIINFSIFKFILHVYIYIHTHRKINS